MGDLVVGTQVVLFGYILSFQQGWGLPDGTLTLSLCLCPRVEMERSLCGASGDWSPSRRPVMPHFLLEALL